MLAQRQPPAKQPDKQRDRGGDPNAQKLRGKKVEQQAQRARGGIEKVFLGVNAKKEMPVYFAPVVSFNDVDGMLIGFSAHNNPAQAKHFEFVASPLFGLGSKNLLGAADFRYNVLKKNEEVPVGSIGINWRSFNNGEFIDSSSGVSSTRFMRFAPFVDLHWNPGTHADHMLKFQSLVIAEQKPTALLVGDSVVLAGAAYQWRSTHRLMYRFLNNNQQNPMQLVVQAEGAEYAGTSGNRQGFLKATLEGNAAFSFMTDKKVSVRVFAGAFPFNSDRETGAFPLQLAQQGFKDYQYDNLAMGRGSSTGGFANQQVITADGGFKTPLQSDAIVGIAPQSNVALASFNLASDIPLKLPFGIPSIVKVRPYFDFAYFRGSDPVTLDLVNKTAFNTGVNIDFFEGAAAIYFPIASSKDLSESMKANGNYFSRISFSLNLKKIDPFERLRREKQVGELVKTFF